MANDMQIFVPRPLSATTWLTDIWVKRQLKATFRKRLDFFGAICRRLFVDFTFAGKNTFSQC